MPEVSEAVPPMSPARRRVLAVLAERPFALGVDEVRALIGGHPNGIRNHLTALVATGLATRTPRATSDPVRPGRPTYEYQVTALGARGHALSRAPVPASGYAALAGSLVAALTAGAAPGRAADAAREAGRAWGDRMRAPGEAPVGVGVEQVVTALAGQGYEPVAGGPTTVQLRACPVLDLALEQPDVVCGVHVGILEALAGTAVSLEPFAGPDGCVVRLAPPVGPAALP